MRSGLLWYDGDPKKSIWDKIDEAVQRYQDKFGVQPNSCVVHPQSLSGSPSGKTNGSNMRIKTAPTVLPNHIWLGVSE